MERKLTGMTPTMLVAGITLGNVMAGTPGAIEQSERDGQAELVIHNNRLPKNRGDDAPWLKLGFRFGEVIDDLFQEATFPDGWSLKATDHSMHSDIVDGQGRRRGSVFYKAAFYDMSADAHLIGRYYTRKLYNCDEPSIPAEHSQIGVVDSLTDKPVKTFGEPIAWGSQAWDVEKEQRDAAAAWLAANYPDHADITAYWD